MFAFYLGQSSYFIDIEHLLPARACSLSILLQKALAGIIPFGFNVANATVGPTEKDLNLAYIEAMSKGLTPKFVLLTNPNNPLGVIYKSQIIKDTIEWARKRNLHTIVDEIHALSAHADGAAATPDRFQNQHRSHLPAPSINGFQSVIQIMNNELGNDVHMVWGLSKDFGASGLRVGVLYSQNEIFMKALAASNIAIFSCVSGPIQYVVSELLTDDAFIDHFLEESRSRLRQSYEICVLKLEEMVVPFVPAEAGLFVYVDFSSLLPQKTFEWERKLSQLMFDHARVVLTPGETQQERTPGMFRICYAWVSPGVLEIAMERLSRLIGKVRRMDWSDLNERTLGGIL
jgi:1-aminocyclopropane-1-carboxylate synthase